MSGIKEIFIIRHGETDYNKQGIIQGKGVNPPLNDKGRKQAQLFFDHYQNEKFEFIYTSTLQRTHETVHPFTSRGIPWEQHEELDEICWGVHEGQKVDSHFRQEYQRLLEEWRKGNIDAKTEEGESPKELQEKQQRFIDYLRAQPYNKVLICMHGRAMRIFLSTLLNQSLGEMDQYPHHNVCLYKLKDDGKTFTIELFNDLNHLNGAH